MQNIKRRLYPVAAGLTLVVLSLTAQLAPDTFVAQLLHRLESVAYDLRLSATLPEQVTPDARIVIVDVDEKSLKNEGRWPWSRAKLAELVERLFENKVAVAAFDVLFTEPERNPAQQVLGQIGTAADAHPLLQGAVRQMDYDGQFAASLQGRDVVLGYVFNNSTDRVGELPPPLQVTHDAALRDAAIKSMPGYSANLARLQQAAGHAGFFTIEPDSDGILRRAALILRHGDRVYPSLALEAVRVFYGADTVTVNTASLTGSRRAVESVNLGDYAIPTDLEGRVIIPYRGMHPAFTYVSASDVLRGAVAKEKLENTIVFVGTTAAGLQDQHATPMQPVYPGVEVHATIAAAILDQRFPARPSWAEGADVMVLLTLGLALAWWLPLLSARRAVGLSAFAGVALLSANLWAWQAEGWVLALATPLILVLTLTLLNMAYGFLIEARGRAELKGMFGQYVPPELVEEMNRNPQSLGFEGDSREMSILFSDIRSFTTISERLSANELKKLLNRFFTPMTRIVFNRRGTIDKYVGDMMMAFWGAPLRDDEHARHALEAAFDMLAALEEAQAGFRASGLPEIDIGIGINSGVVNVGDMGSEFRRAYTVIGDAVNLASRIESLTKFYGVRLIVGENTRHGQDDFIFRRLDRVRVKGKKEAVTIYEPLCRRHEASAQVLEETAWHEQALDHYLARRWDEAEALFVQLAARRPDAIIYSLYLARIRELRLLAPEAEWDGVYSQKDK